MKPKQFKPTSPQYVYMMTGLLAACIQRTGTVTEADVQMAIDTTRHAFDAISSVVAEVIDETEQQEAEAEKKAQEAKEMADTTDYFADLDFGTFGVYYSDLEKHLKQRHGITSNRKIGKIYHAALELGYIIKNNETRKYTRPQ